MGDLVMSLSRACLANSRRNLQLYSSFSRMTLTLSSSFLRRWRWLYPSERQSVLGTQDLTSRQGSSNNRSNGLFHSMMMPHFLVEESRRRGSIPECCESQCRFCCLYAVAWHACLSISLTKYVRLDLNHFISGGLHFALLIILFVYILTFGRFVYSEQVGQDFINLDLGTGKTNCQNNGFLSNSPP